MIRVRNIPLENVLNFNFQSMALVFNASVNGSILPYQKCLILNIPADVQHQVRDITNYAVIPVGTLLAILSLVANLLVSTAIVRTRALQHPSQLLLCSLSVTDIIWAFNALVNNVVKITHEHKCPEEFTVQPGIAVLCYMSTMGNLAIISRDRYVALNRPWMYRHNNTRKAIFKKIIAVWLYSTFVAVAVLISTIYEQARDILTLILAVLIALFYLGCFLVIMSSYVGIFVASRRHRREMPQIAAQVHSTLIREKKVASTVTLIMLAFVFTFLPALLVPVVLAVLNQNFAPMRPLYNVFITLNGFLNPLFNFGRNEDVRKTIRTLMRCHQRNGQIVPLRSSAVTTQ